MADQAGPESSLSPGGSGANLALGLGLAALVTWIAAIIVIGDSDDHGWMWILTAALGLGAVIAGWTSRQGQRPTGRALAGMIVGGLLVLLFLGFVITDLLT